VVVDRFKVRSDLATRLAESFETALELSGGTAVVADMDNPKAEELVFSANFACPHCGYSVPELEPRLFSFNNPAGACPTCDGLGVQQFFDESRVVQNESISLAGGAVKGWDRRNFYYYQMLTSLAKHYKFDIEYQNDKFEQMSPGKKAFVVLKLILDFSNSRVPVLIDQPEDSLDNRAIYHELTAYIKQRKLKRQIIIVTHNPNIVVSGDCENVIVANQHSENNPNPHNKVFAYKNGALENQIKEPDSNFILNKKCIKEHVCEILEGGIEAFKRREDKYGIKIDNLNSPKVIQE